MTDFVKIDDKRPTLEEAQAFVGGYVEMIMVDGTQVLINEGGKGLRLPMNEAATMYCNQPIVGPAMVLSGEALWD